MRVLLINPWEDGEFLIPSIGYLQAALKHYQVDVVVNDLNESLSNDDDYDIIAVTFHSFSVKYATIIRNKFKGHLICGGQHSSALPEQMLSIGYDQVVIGEGENAIIDIIHGNTDQIIKNCEYKYFSQIDDFPVADYSGMRYYGSQGIPIISSRGCCFHCIFCSSTAFWGKYRMRTPENVLSEIEQRKSEGYKTWIFYDDNFTANKKRALEICSELDGSMMFQAVGRAESMDAELCHALYKAGCKKVHLGVESLSQDALDRMGKNTTVEKILNGIAITEDTGIGTMSLFLVGLPGDTYENIQETRRNRLRSKITQYGSNVCWILPGTQIHTKALEHGFDNNVYLHTGAPFYTYEHSFEELTKWSQEI